MKIKKLPVILSLVIVFLVLIILLMLPMFGPSRPLYFSRSINAPENILSQDETKPSAVSNPGSSIPAPRISLKIIKTAEVRFQVKNLEKSFAAIESLVKSNGGYLASENRRNYDEQVENTLVIRIPTDHFDQLIQGLNGQIVFLDYKNIEAKDVTEEFVDTEARLKAKREVELRYLVILKQAKTVQEILEVESRLGTIREEIEAVEGKFRYLNDQIAYSTITLTIYQHVRQQARPENSFWKRLENSLVTGWKGFLAVLIGLTALWPLIIIVAGGIWVYRGYVGKKKKSGLAG